MFPQKERKITVPHIIECTDLSDPRLHDFTNLTDVALRRVQEPAEGIYIAESLKVISRAIAVGHIPRAILCGREWLSQVETLTSGLDTLPIFVGSSELLEHITGYHVHRGALAAMSRPAGLNVIDVVREANSLVILEGIMDHTNVGAIFRSVVALGADAVLITNDCADPLYRRSVRVSMGAALSVPWARMTSWTETRSILESSGFTIAALSLTPHAVPISETSLSSLHKVALVLGSEGNGLSEVALKHSDLEVYIPMRNGVDSLNVAAAAAVAMFSVFGTS